MLFTSSNIAQTLSSEYGISSGTLEEANKLIPSLALPIEQVLVTMGEIDELQLPFLYAKNFNCMVVDEKCVAISPSAIEQTITSLSHDFLISKNVVPLEFREEELLLAIDSLNDWEVIDYLRLLPFNLRFSFGNKKQLALLKEQYDINLQIAKQTVQGAQTVGDGEIEKLRELAQGAPTVSFVNQLIKHGVEIGASDLHLEPVANRYRARYRVDGILHEADPIPQNLQLAVISRVKILSGMDIAEKRRPQDGKIETFVNNVELDIRCSSLPLGQGESMVMRFLVKNAVQFNLADLGYEKDLADRIQEDLKKTAGVILMTGPTGSGKTTSLYSYLNQLNGPEVKVITLEDPIEYQLDGVNQVQVNTDIGFDFAKGLRSIVRQDPDVIMVGEIRDQETARVALQSALTGHLVFSTVHTNDAATAYTRLLDLGVQEYLLNAALISILAQRLVRKLCDCAEERPEDEQQSAADKYGLRELANQFDVSDIKLKHPKGCQKCGHSGYKGRVAILEYLPCNDDIMQLPKGEQFLIEAANYMSSQQLRTLKQDGLLKAIKGQTTIEEVLRVAG